MHRRTLLSLLPVVLCLRWTPPSRPLTLRDLAIGQVYTFRWRDDPSARVVCVGRVVHRGAYWPLDDVTVTVQRDAWRGHDARLYGNTAFSITA